MSHMPTGEDNGLGPEFFDPSTQMAETTIDPHNEAKVAAAQSRGPGYWIAVGAILVLVVEQIGFTMTLYTPILGDLSAEFHTTQIVWFMTIVMVTGGVCAPLMAKASDIYGKRRVLSVGLGVATIGWTVSALAPTFEVMLVGRALQAGTMGFIALGVGLVRETFPVGYRAIAIGAVTAGGGIPSIGGPLLTGWLTHSWGFRAPFVLQMILGAVCIVLLFALVPESAVRVRSRIDYVGALLLGLGAVTIMYGLSEIQTKGSAWITVGLPILGIALLTVWWWYSRRTSEPLLNVQLLTRRAVIAPVAAASFCIGALNSMLLLTVLAWSAPVGSVSYGRGLSPIDIGIWMIPFGVLAVLSGLLVGATVRSIGFRIHMIAASICVTVAATVMAFNLDSAAWVAITAFGLAGLGFAANAAAASLVMLASPPDQRAIAMSMNNTIASIFGAGVQQVVYVLLGSTAVVIVNGVSFYGDGGYTIAFLGTAASALLAAVFGILVPHGRRQPKQQRDTVIPDNHEEVVAQLS